MFGVCGGNFYVLSLQTSEPFRGRVFSQGYKTCAMSGNGSKSMSLRVDAHCGLGELEPGFRDQIYVQKDPGLQQAGDELLEIICNGSSTGSPASLIRYDGASQPMFYQNLQTTFKVNETKDSFMESEPEEINEIDTGTEEVYVQAWMDILSMAGDSFFVGQNVSLLIKWKKPSSKDQPRVGSCTASSGNKESLALSDERGQSLQKIFPAQFSYTSSNSGITSASASFLMFKFAKSNKLILRCRLRFPPSKVPIVLEALAENIGDQKDEEETEYKSLNQEKPSHYLRSDDLSAQEAKQELLDIQRDDFEEPQVCMSRLRMVLSFGVLILVLFVALIFSCMLWSRAKSFTSQLNSSKPPRRGGLFPGRLKRVPGGPYVLPSGPYR